MSPKKAEPKVAGVGQSVIFVSNDGKHRAAVITHVWDGERVNLFVFPDASFPLISNTPTSVTFNENAATYTWHRIE